MTFSDALVGQIRAKNSRCIVGLDPNIDLIPAPFKAEMGLDPAVWQKDIARIYLEYNKLVIEQVYDLVPAVKPQIAYYETLGAEGFTCLTETVNYARSKGLLVVLDAKRSDIGSTSTAYAMAYLSGGLVPGAAPAIQVDALTINPFMGMDSIEPFLTAAHQHGKGTFVLVKTSNPGSGDIQGLPAADGNVSELLASKLNEVGQQQLGKEGYSPIGAVVGATYPEEARRLRSRLPNSFFLVPGYGTQGGGSKGLDVFFNADGLGAIVNASRSICFPGDKNLPTSSLANYFRTKTEEMVKDVNSAVVKSRV